MTALRPLADALNRLATTTGAVWWNCLPQLLTVSMLGWLGYNVFQQLAAMVVTVSAWWSLAMLAIGFVINLSAIIIGLRIAGQRLRIRQMVPLAADDPRDDSVSHLLSMTLLPFLGIYAVFDVITDAANDIQVNYYVFHGLTFENEVLAQLKPQGNGIWLIVGIIVGLYVVRRLIERWFDHSGWRPLGLLAALVEGFFMLIVVLSGRQLLVSLGHWVEQREFRVWLDQPRLWLERAFATIGVDISGLLDRITGLWTEQLWPAAVAMVVEPMLWLALAALVFGTQVLSIADLWRRGRPVEVELRRSRVQLGDRQRRVTLLFQDAFWGDLNDKYLPTFQSLRLVLSAGAGFLGAFIVCYGVLVTGAEWFRRGLYALVGGHPATFWAAAGPLIDLAHTLLLEPLRWVLLATAFHQCLARFAAREGVDGEPASSERSVRGAA